jgi:hypothetical protein
MRKLAIGAFGFVLLCCLVPRVALADISLQESLLVVNGTQYYDTFSVPGLNTASFNQTTGLGSITLTFNPGPGSYSFDSYFDIEAGVPFFNEYGTVNGSPVAGQTWQIDDPLAGTIFPNAQGDTLDNTNHIPGKVDNFLGDCSGANCNGDVSMAMGFDFTITSGNEEVITLNLSQTAPTGFYLVQTHPQDPNNASPVNIYFSGTATQKPITSGVPEPGTWILLGTGLGLLLLTTLRLRLKVALGRSGGSLLALLVLLLGVPQLGKAIVPKVLTVPEVPGTPTTPHTTYPLATISLGATAANTSGSTDTFQVTWDFGDKTGTVTFNFVGTATSAPYAYDISTTHIYATTIGTPSTATVTVKDMNTGETGSNTYLVLMEANTLASRVDVAIDNGLWYMHQTMWRTNAPANGQPVNWGGWDGESGSPGCVPVAGNAFDCTSYSVIDPANVQAFEVSGHLASGPATDPYTDDVARGLARIFSFLALHSVAANAYNFNPATADYGCSSGYPTTSFPNCQAPATQVFYDAGSTACPSPPCNYTFDGNSNKQYLSVDLDGEPHYEGGQFVDAIVASAAPTAKAPTGAGPSGGLPGVIGQTYQNIVQDLIDEYGNCQYNSDFDVSSGYVRGSNQAQGGAWLYTCLQGDDNSVSQWAAIGYIGALRGFNLATPQAVKDFNEVWVTNSEDVGQSPAPTGTDPWAVGDYLGSYGYRGAIDYSNAWGPFADTPSGLVQMAMDDVGRTQNKVFGDSTTSPDQRWNYTESWYADNFCNNPSSGAYYSPRAYTYGMFSFTKSMLLHDPAGVLTPIQYLRTLTPNVFTGDPSVPPNTIDWYAALSAANGGKDACDGIAQTLVGYQNVGGYWSGHNYTSTQYPFETAWSIIMLRKTVFVSCISNLYGKGTPSGPGHPARVDLTWSAQANATSYDILRGTANGGPYTKIGNTTSAAFSDRSGLTNGDTYYYVNQPLQGTTEICQSNQAKVTIPLGR